jgi:zinc transport system ATP-binding protein
VSDPELLILDEPTAGVDLASQQIFADAIRDRVARGTTVVMVSHDLGPMDALIDRSVVLRRGRVVYDGPPHASQTHAHVHHSHSGDEPGWLSS